MSDDRELAARQRLGEALRSNNFRKQFIAQGPAAAAATAGISGLSDKFLKGLESLSEEELSMLANLEAKGGAVASDGNLLW